MEECLTDISGWMRSMKLKINDSKTEYMVIGTRQQLAKCTDMSIIVGESEVEASEFVRNLGAYFDKYMLMEHHIKIKCRAAYAKLFNISKIRKYLDDKSTEQLIHALVHSHIDYCNALLYGLPHCLIQKLQKVQNTAARVLCRLRKFDHITPTLKKLHWLPVEFRIKFKICLMTLNALHGHSPQYIKDMFTIRNTGYGLRSSGVLTLEEPHTRRKTLGDRSFKAAAPRLWNSLPKELRHIDDVDTFKRKLKTHYFTIAYKRVI